MTQHHVPTFLPEALYSKSQLYIRRGFRAKQAGDLDEYQLWASLALELLGKAALAKISPALIADPTHQESLFSACGVQIGTDLKTITAKTLFLRLPHITKDFDQQVQKFCEQSALKRNAELHSGELPFTAASQEAWEKKYWYAIAVILAAQTRTLEEWLGAEDAKAPQQVLQDTQHAINGAVAERIERKAKEFQNAYSKQKREELIKDSRDIRPWNYYQEFSINTDEYRIEVCPSCSANGILAGVLWSEEVSEEFDPEDPMVEFVDKTYLSEEFRCFTCGLALLGRREVVAANFPEEFYDRDTREREFEPDYGND